MIFFEAKIVKSKKFRTMKKPILHILTVAIMMISSYCYAHLGPIMAGKNTAVVHTQYGDVRGYTDVGIYAFKGISYPKADRFMPHLNLLTNGMEFASSPRC